MKSFVCLPLIVVIVSVATASSKDMLASSVNSDRQQDLESDLKGVQTLQLNNEHNRFRKSASYVGSSAVPSIPGHPCPKNYLFSCQPNLAPVPCSAPPHSFGPSGAYSAPVPTYMAPLQNGYGLPQGYGGLAPQNFNQFYQY